MKIIRRVVIKIAISILLLLVLLYAFFIIFTSPKSTTDILKSYEKSTVQPKISKESFNGFPYRKIEIKTDTTKPTIVFVHGSIGSINDFNNYLSDSLLQSKFNMICYDRIGYNYNDKNDVQESIAFERSHLQNVIKNIPLTKIILVGYSYGGPIALSIKEKVKKTVLIAPAVYSKVEPMPWALNFYKWKMTRWLVPNVWQQASKEKISHKKDLENFENNWKSTKNNVISIHGTKDWIVPLSNSEFLSKLFPQEQFKLIIVNDARHNIIWSNFDEIKKQLLQLV